MVHLGAPAARADAINDKSDLFLKRKIAASAQPQTGWSSVIARLDGELTKEREQAIRQLGGYVYRRLPLIDSAAVRIPNRSLVKLAQISFVKRLSSDEAVKKNDEFTVEHSGADTALGSYGLTGQGVTVAVVDSGIANWHVDLKSGRKSRILANVNFVPGTKSAYDDCGHGTHVAGIVAGNGAASSGSWSYRSFYGIARKANLVNVRVLNQYGQGSVSSVIAGIQWAVNNRTRYNIRVLNLSLGHPVGESYTTDPLCQAVESAWKAGIVVVCAAGNDGRNQAGKSAARNNEGFGTKYGSIQSPANSPYVITVGAMKASPYGRAGDRIATYSGRGPSRIDMVMKPDIVAPGNRIISLHAVGSKLSSVYDATNRVKFSEYMKFAWNSDSAYFRLSGTSMAAPVVSGAAALMLEQDPTLTPDTVKARLMISADKWGFGNGSTDPLTFGAGYLNIPAALNSPVVAKGPALSPPLIRDSQGNVYVDASRIIWGEAAEVWGIEGVDSLRVIWGGAALEDTLDPATDLLTSSRVIWGESVWMDRVIWDIVNFEVDLSSKTIYGEE